MRYPMLIISLLCFMLFRCASNELFPEVFVDKPYDSNKSRIRFESGPFDPQKPTIVFFGGGNCVDSWDPTEAWESEETQGDVWFDLANVISFEYYQHDLGRQELSYRFCSELIVDTLKALAPGYSQDVQACGFSTGGTPALELAVFINSNDLEYEATRVTLMDAPCYDYHKLIGSFMQSGGEGAPRLVENLRGGGAMHWDEHKKPPYPSALNVDMFPAHDEIYYWYVNSLSNPDLYSYNEGISAGAFWSVIGTGRNVGLPADTLEIDYHFRYSGDENSGSFTWIDGAAAGNRLPDPERQEELHP